MFKIRWRFPTTWYNVLQRGNNMVQRGYKVAKMTTTVVLRFCYVVVRYDTLLYAMLRGSCEA